MLYKGDDGVSDAARSSEDGPTEAGDLSASSLPLSIDRPARILDDQLKSLCTKQRLIALPCWEEVYPRVNRVTIYKV